MASSARQHPPLETVLVSAATLSERELQEVADICDVVASRPSTPRGPAEFWAQLADQLRSVASWREGTLAALQADFDEQRLAW